MSATAFVKVPCQYVKMGKPCKFGKDCKYSHDVQNKTQKPGPVKLGLVKERIKEVGMNMAKQEFSKMQKVHKALDEKRLSLVKEQAEFNKSAYFMLGKDAKDVKSADPFVDRIKFYEDQLKTQRAMMRDFWGTKIFKVRMPQVYNIQASAGGVINGVLSVDPTAQTEFTSMASIFDEFRVVSGEIKFAASSSIATGVAVPCHTSIAYDPVEGTIATSQLELMQLLQHKLVFCPTTMTSLQNAVATHLHDFVFHIPKGNLEINVTNGAIGEGQWQTTVAGATWLPYGYIKTYGANLTVNSSVYTGFLFYDLEFRCRT